MGYFKGVLLGGLAILLIVGLPDLGRGEEMTFAVVYNNLPYNRNLKTSWGNACLIEGAEETILFDTGGDGSILLSNLEELKIEPSDIDVVVLSHIHGDHIGGLWEFLEENSKIRVYFPHSFPQSFQDRVRSYGAEAISVSKSTEVCKGVYSTGEMGTFIKEQSLIVKTEKGLAILTGCAHPGIVKIVEESQKLLNERTFLILGGFHLMGCSRKEIQGIIEKLRQMGVEKIAPNHCSGEKAIKMFRKEWGKDFIDAGCGAIIKVD
ncbi:Ribonuclease BN [subsurface metagenome]|nr:MBL fold metallo-hydrolase [Bacillota bacterium]